jgi:catechol 2,3-dioxygenase-like lactoylglutathione lyase family enzyme
MAQKLRIARPVSNLERTRDMYCKGLGLHVVGGFQNHEGFDGIMLGYEGSDYHFEFTHFHNHPITPCSTPEDLIVLYLPEKEEWTQSCLRMMESGFQEVEAFNPYWRVSGRTFQDADGYRIVLQNAEWTNRAI